MSFFTNSHQVDVDILDRELLYHRRFLCVLCYIVLCTAGYHWMMENEFMSFSHRYPNHDSAPRCSFMELLWRFLQTLKVYEFQELVRDCSVCR